MRKRITDALQSQTTKDMVDAKRRKSGEKVSPIIPENV
jgi:hypothetical protein